MEKIKEFFKNPQYRSLVIIFSYFLIGFIIIGIVNLNTNENTSNKKIVTKEDNIVTKEDKIDLMNNYQYKITYNDEIVTGSYINNEISFIYRGKQYNSLDLDINPLFLITYDDLVKLISESTHKYTGKDLIDNYDIDTYINQIDNKQINITQYKKNNEIKKIILDVDNQKTTYEYYKNESRD